MRTGSRPPAAPVRAGSRLGRRGFTLVELAVVILVLGMVVVLSAPALPRPRRGADATAHAMADLLRRARRDAAREGGVRAVEVEPESGRYRIRTRASDGSDSIVGEGALPIPGSVSLFLPAEGDGRTVRFNALGRAEGGAFRVRDADGNRRIVVIDRFTGSVRVEIE